MTVRHIKNKTGIKKDRLTLITKVTNNSQNASQTYKEIDRYKERKTYKNLQVKITINQLARQPDRG